VPVKKIFLDCFTFAVVPMMSRNVGDQLPTYVKQHHRTAKASRSLLFSTASAGKHFFFPINIQHARGKACRSPCTDRKLMDMLYDGFLVTLFDMKYAITYSVNFLCFRLYYVWLLDEGLDGPKHVGSSLKTFRMGYLQTEASFTWFLFLWIL